MVKIFRGMERGTGILMNEAIEYTLKTWYPKDHKLHFDPRHPAIKLTGEAGEILDLYGKHEYKPDFDWWQCKTCRNISLTHQNPDHDCWQYEPLITDELGDWWYYWRILCYQDEYSALDVIDIHQPYIRDILDCLIELSHYSINVLSDYNSRIIISTVELTNAFREFSNLIYTLDLSLDDITKLNYQKLNSDSTHHGWKDA